MKVHELKINQQYCIDILINYKTFEIRKNDRGFKVGDIIHLKEIDDVTKDYTGFEFFVKIWYIHEGLGLEEGYVCMSIEKTDFK